MPRAYEGEPYYNRPAGHWWPPALARWCLGQGVPATAADLGGSRKREKMASRGSPRERWMWRSGFRACMAPWRKTARIQGWFQADAGAVRGLRGWARLGGGMDKQGRLKGALSPRRIPVPYAAFRRWLEAEPEQLLAGGGQLGYPLFRQAGNLGLLSGGISKATDTPSC